MAKNKSVQDTHMSSELRLLHDALISIVSVMNSPYRDEGMVREAGISLDGALFPLLVGIERAGPIGVVDLADRVGRDYTTVSRQVAKLESLSLVSRQESVHDRRVREAIVTPEGQKMADAVDAARERIGRAIFFEWSENDFEELVRLMQKFAKDIEAHVPAVRKRS